MTLLNFLFGCSKRDDAQRAPSESAREWLSQTNHTKPNQQSGGSSVPTEQPFAPCCEDLQRAMSAPPKPLIQVTEIGSLTMAVGYENTAKGVAWYEQGILHCPFCGKKLMDKEEIRRRMDAYRAKQQQKQ